MSTFIIYGPTIYGFNRVPT